MRRLDLLINDVRFNTDNMENSRYSDIRMLKFFNDAQRALQKLIHTRDTSGRFFSRDSNIDLVGGQELYDMPEDLFANSAINSVGRLVTVSAGNNTYYTKMRQLLESERRKEFGYAPQGTKVIVSPIPSILLTNGLRFNYTYRVPTLSFRVGKIKSFISATEIKVELSSLFGVEDDITNYTDYVTTVDVLGNITKTKILIDSYDKTSGKVKTSTDLTAGDQFVGGPEEAGVSVGDYMVIGRVATTNSQLPEICEQMLTDLVERKIHAVDSSTEVNMSQLITQEEKDDISLLFKDAEQDVKYPPINDDTYLNF